MSEQRARRRIIVRGEVQGVFFRDSTQDRAQAEDVSGWVRNRSDGAVEVVAEGAPDAVERMVDFCREGPGRAQVQDVEVSEEEPEGLSGFEVR
ncbi:MAG: acylphosphatase [Solirubrobacterales bacterium]|nr:acylphosphatase [Solirubrobacterales bacterium]